MNIMNYKKMRYYFATLLNTFLSRGIRSERELQDIIATMKIANTTEERKGKQKWCNFYSHQQLLLEI